MEKSKADQLAKPDQQLKVGKSRIDQLAKPNDKWKVGKRLLELQKQFPHDRVIQRMVKQEF